MVALDAADELEKEIPFGGMIITAINILAGLAQITETITSACESPWNITNTVSTSITSTVNLHPDPRHGAFPSGSAEQPCTQQVSMIFKNQKRPTGSSGAVSVPTPVPAGTPLTYQFPANTLGGEVQFQAAFYVGNTLAGTATSGWMANNSQNSETINLWLVEIPVALTSQSAYQHSQILTYSNGSYGWTETSQPAPYLPSNAVDTGNNIAAWGKLNLNQSAQSLGYVWQAAGMGIVKCGTDVTGQLYAMKNIPIPGGSGPQKFSSCGLDSPPPLRYDPFPPKFLKNAQTGQWVINPQTNQPVPDPNAPSLGNFYIDPRNTGWHLRQVTLNDTPFSMTEELSWGRFPVAPDAMALHPCGNIVAINTAISKIYVLEVADGGLPDEQAPMARWHAGPATSTARPGLTFNPIAVACSYDGTIFVLENSRTGNATVARIQAFDIHGNPVNRFPAFRDDPYPGSMPGPMPIPSPFLYLSNAEELTFLDLACSGDEKMTYLFVLGYTNNGSSTNASDFQVAVYQVGPAQSASNLLSIGPLFTTPGVAAASIATDMWHSLYTLNYQMTTNGQGSLAGPSGPNTGPAGRTVPSVSLWIPQG